MALVYLDHIVILLSHKDVLNPPKWLTDHFTITPGGVHAGGKTENKLIIFQDGSYIELIAFVDDDPKNRAGHRWGDKKVGIIDYALITKEDAEENYKSLKARLEKADVGVKYAPPTAGGRKRDDGQVLQWKVTAPEAPTLIGEAPFFCHDVTARELRVPFSEESTTHPSGAYGVQALTIYVPEERIDKLSKAYEAILDSKNSAKYEKEGRFEVGSLRRQDTSALSIQEPKEEGDKKVVGERGVLLADLRIGKTPQSGGTEENIWLDWDVEFGNTFISASSNDF